MRVIAPVTSDPVPQRGTWVADVRRVAGLSVLTVFLHLLVCVAQKWIAPGGRNMSTGVVAYCVAIVSLGWVYLTLIYTVPAVPSRREWVLIAGVPIVLGIGWLVSLPRLAIDTYSYVVAAAQTHAGLNPYFHAAREAAVLRLATNSPPSAGDRHTARRRTDRLG